MGRGTVVLALMACAISSMAIAAPICPKVSAEEFKKALVEKGAEEVVFFASWCLACKEHIQKAGDKTAFVAVFDDGVKAEKAFVAVGGKGPCYFDESGAIAKQYGVTSLPAKINVNEKPKS